MPAYKQVEVKNAKYNFSCILLFNFILDKNIIIYPTSILNKNKNTPNKFNSGKNSVKNAEKAHAQCICHLL